MKKALKSVKLFTFTERNPPEEKSSDGFLLKLIPELLSSCNFPFIQRLEELCQADPVLAGQVSKVVSSLLLWNNDGEILVVQ